MKYVYIAGPYTGQYHDHRSFFEIDRNIARATEAAAQLATAGVGFFNPHGHSAHFEVITPDVSPDFWYELDIHFLRHCDAILMLDTWENSKGSLREKQLAEARWMPVFYSIQEVLKWAHDSAST